MIGKCNTSGGVSSAADIEYDNTTSGITAENVQGALDELASKEVTVDSALSSDSTNPVQNKVVYSALEDKAPTYTYGTEDLTAGTSPLETGKLHFVYE